MQSLSSPLTITIIPTNTHPLQVTLNDSQLTYTENSVLEVLAGLTLSDMDENCGGNAINSAVIEVDGANDNVIELLVVSVSIALYYFL